MTRRVARWLMVSCAGGAPILALDTGRRWQGWIVPWFPDPSMERIGATYFKDEQPERAPVQEACGTWAYRDDDDESVPLPRYRKQVEFPGGARGFLALTDAGEMGWCWTEVDPVDEKTWTAALAAAASELELPKRREKVARGR